MVNGGDAPGVELPALDHRHAGHHQQVTVDLHLLGTVVAPAAVGDARLLPFHRGTSVAVFRRELAEAPASFAEHGEQVGKGVVATQPVLAHPGAQHQGDVRRWLQAHAEELVAVRRELEQGADLGVPGQFGVPDFVATGASCAGGLIDQEVRVAQELAVEERGLENDVGPGTQGQLGFSVPGLQVPAQVRSAFQ